MKVVPIVGVVAAAVLIVTGGDRRLHLAGAIGGPLSLLTVAIAEPEVE
jgi:hypothetical protein